MVATVTNDRIEYTEHREWDARQRKANAQHRKSCRDVLKDQLEAHIDIAARLRAMGAVEVNTGMLAAKFAADPAREPLEAPEVANESPEERRRREEREAAELLFHSAG